ncbi:MAG: hypothetical protein ABL951_02680 [Alphaproteobacteria bacterium]
MTDPITQSIIATISGASASFNTGYEKGLEIGMAICKARLDQAWAEINALGGAEIKGYIVGAAYNKAIGDALGIIERLGGSDPLKGSEHD